MNLSGKKSLRAHFIPFTCFLAGSLLFLSCELGESPIAPKIAGTDAPVVTPDSGKDNMRIRALPPSLTAGGEGDAVIEVTAFDANHNPIAGKEVLFTATSGIISAKDTTCNLGLAFADFTADPDGGDAIITAKMVIEKTVLTVSTTVRVIGAAVGVDSVNKNMRIRSFPSTLLASYDETAGIEVTVFDDNRNPIVGKEIMLSSTRGIVTAKDTTDSAGIAHALFTAEPVNANVTVSAGMMLGDSMVSVATTVTLNGIAIIIVPQLSSAPVDAVVPVKIRLLDGKGNPLPDQEIRFIGNDDSTKTTSGTGEVATSVTRSSAGKVTIMAAALGTSDSASVFFGTLAPIDSDNTIRSLRLFTSHSQLRADNSAEATVTSIIISEDNHNPLVGDTVKFSSTLGIIDKYGVTDSTGRTTVTLRSAPVNGNCVIRAVLKGNSAIKDSTTVLFSGVTLELSADRNNIRINDTALVQALLKDGSGNPIGSDIVNFSIVAPGGFADNTRLTQSTLSATGIATVKVTSGTAGQVAVHAASANITDVVFITFTTNNLTISSAKNALTIGGRDSTKISVQYLDMSGNPLAGKTITFATNAGSLTSLAAVTNGNGVATTWLKSGYFAAEATVQAKSPDGSTYAGVSFNAAKPGSIALAVTPDNIGINGGIASLIATVKDTNGNVVSGAEVSFRILKGPGGGEQIDKPIIVSTNDGIARAQLLAGTLPSTYRGCEVEAFVDDLAATTKLTISGEPYTITVSRPQDDTVTVPNAGKMDESTFEYFIGAVVQDVNGNPVADGTPVNFSAFVSGMKVTSKNFVRWETTGGDVKPIIEYVYYDIPFEDINGNFRYDPGIDLDLDNYPAIASRGNDRNGNGILEYNIMTDGFFWDFNGNGICDTSSGKFHGEPYYGNLKPTTEGDSLPDFYADLNSNGRWDRYEWVGNAKSTLPAEAFTTPLGFDFEFWRWEMRGQFCGQRLDFTDNDYAVAIDRTAVTKDGVASTKLTYPRQLALRLFATVNAEVKGIRDRDGERFVLPVIK